VGGGDGGAPDTFDAAGLADAIDARIVQPTRAAQALFAQHPYLTRLFTAISPEDMNLDPVFSENPSLPGVAALHTATLTYPCKGDPWLRTDQGFEVQYPGGIPPYSKTFAATLRLERLREIGPPEVELDQTPLVEQQAGPVSHGSGGDGGGSSGGCEISRRVRNQLASALAIGLALLLLRRRQRR
jgi:hypothetical protein